MKRVIQEKRTFKAIMKLLLITLYACGGGGGTIGNISNESSSQSQPSGSNQNSTADQSISLNVEIVRNRFGQCNFGECKFE